MTVEQSFETILYARNEQARVEAIAAAATSEAALFTLVEHAVARFLAADAADDMPMMYGMIRSLQVIVRSVARPEPRHLAAVLPSLSTRYEMTELNAGIVALAERCAANGHAAAIQPMLTQLHEALAEDPRKEGRLLRERIDVLRGVAPSSDPEPGLRFSDAMLATLATLPADERAAWTALFAQGEGATAARPSARWQRETAQRVAAIGRARFLSRLGEWLPLVEKPKQLAQQGWQYLPPISDGNTRLLVALTWALGGGGEAEAARLAGDLASVAFTKIAGYGPVSAKVGNACVWALGAMPGLEGVAQLTRLRLRVKYAQAQRLLARSLDEAAQRAGLTVADVEELAVPVFGLDSDGKRRVSFAESGWTAEVSLGRRRPEVTFTHADKKTPKSVPADVKSQPQWKALKKEVEHIEQQLGVERTRIERYYLSQRELPLADLRARAFEHPVVGQVARRLLWNVAVPGEPTRITRWHDGGLRDLGNVAVADDQARVSLWHPLGAAADELAVWQDLLEQDGIVQPWKQAHREVYRLDEDGSLAVSARFSGHIVRQHQFAALANQRGWRYRLMGGFDSHNFPELALPAWDLGVELLVDYPENARDDMTAAGIYTHIRTAGVRFMRHGQPLPLDAVPPLVFSEVMRDIDLIVSVSSIATDPSWLSRLDHAYADYWRAQLFAALGPSAATRRAVVARVLARLPAATKLAIDDRFVLVQGKRRRYKVHLGSGAVLLDPTEQPIAVPKVPALDVQLPFEGDALLQAILETALALVDDDKIRDAQFQAAIGA